MSYAHPGWDVIKRAFDKEGFFLELDPARDIYVIRRRGSGIPYGQLAREQVQRSDFTVIRRALQRAARQHRGHEQKQRDVVLGNKAYSYYDTRTGKWTFCHVKTGTVLYECSHDTFLGTSVLSLRYAVKLKRRQHDKDRDEKKGRGEEEPADTGTVPEGADAAEGDGSPEEAGEDTGLEKPFVGWRAWNMMEPPKPRIGTEIRSDEHGRVDNLPSLNFAEVVFDETPSEPPLLVPMSYGEAWTWGVNEAGCKSFYGARMSGKHLSPAAECQCGFWAYKNMRNMLDYGPSLSVNGVVAAWGRWQEHDMGYRAQFMQPVALVENEETKRFQDMGYTFPVPVMSLAECELYAIELELADIEQAEGSDLTSADVGQFWDPSADRMRILPVSEGREMVRLDTIPTQGQKVVYVWDGENHMRFDLIGYNTGHGEAYFWWRKADHLELDREIIRAIKEYGRTWIEQLARR